MCPFTDTTIKISILVILAAVKYIVEVAMEKGGEYLGEQKGR